MEDGKFKTDEYYSLKEIFEREIKRLEKAIEDTAKEKADKDKVNSAHRFAIINLVLTGVIIIITIINLILK
jgi:hypothetical protein